MYLFMSHDGVQNLKIDGIVQTSDILLPLSTGVEFIKSITNTVEQQILNTMLVGDTLYHSVQVGDKIVKKKDGRDIPMGQGRSGDG